MRKPHTENPHPSPNCSWGMRKGPDGCLIWIELDKAAEEFLLCRREDLYPYARGSSILFVISVEKDTPGKPVSLHKWGIKDRVIDSHWYRDRLPLLKNIVSDIHQFEIKFSDRVDVDDLNHFLNTSLLPLKYLERFLPAIDIG